MTGYETKRIFDGKTFFFSGARKTKKQAQGVAERYRKIWGKGARITPRNQGDEYRWNIWCEVINDDEMRRIATARKK